MLGYVALMLMPLALLTIAGTLLALAQKPIGLQISRLVGAVPGLELAIGTALGLGVLWLAVTIFYSSAVRARIPFRSAAVGGIAAAVALPVVFWAYMNFQIGVSQTSTLGSGFLAFPGTRCSSARRSPSPTTWTASSSTARGPSTSTTRASARRARRS
jgi:4-amino-4-deoxy-L-arabinose transferase-like glycosyltransferase